MILLIDNYDSFTYNLYQILAQFDTVIVHRNDKITLDDITLLAPDKIVISPGPGTPVAAGISMDVVKYCVEQHLPLLGVCLGHQAIVAALGGEINKALLPVHGKKSAIFHHSQGIYQQLPSPFNAGRYHSLYAVRESLPDCLSIDAENSSGMIMGVSHKTAPVYGVQFHPESFLTSYGSELIKNFCNLSKQYLNKLMRLEHLNQSSAQLLCESLFHMPNETQVAAILSLLHAKHETSDEIIGFLACMKKYMIPVHYNADAVDIVGTGGDRANTVNISTTAALLAATCGATVIKHGNISSSSRSGSGNIIEKLGMSLHMTPEQLIHHLEKTHFGFCLANDYHPILKKLAHIRRDLGMPTIFNLLGPLLNPARVPYLLCGVYSKRLLPVFADVLLAQDIKHAFVVYGNGLDELNCLGTNDVIEIVDGQRHERVIDPKDYGFEYGTLNELKGGSVAENHDIILNVLSGRQPGTLANTIALNTGVALYISGVFETIDLGVSEALSALREGRGIVLLEQLRNHNA